MTVLFGTVFCFSLQTSLTIRLKSTTLKFIRLFYGFNRYHRQHFCGDRTGTELRFN